MGKKYWRNHSAKSAFIRGLKSSFRQMFTNAKRFGWSHQFILESREKLLKGNGVTTSAGQWEKLTALDQAELFGYWDALSDAMMDALEFRYLINGKWYLPREVCERKDGTDPARDIPSPCNNGHFVHVINTESGPEYRIWS